MKLSKRFLDAFTYAFELHTETRKETEIPYVSHLMGVASIVLEQGGNENEAIAALLHDAVEDKGGEERLTDIERRFGPAVAAIVDGCTDAVTQPKPPWKERKERYLAHLPQASPSVKLVSAADKLNNARLILEHYRDLGDDLFNRFRGGKDGTLWYYRSLASIFSETGPATIAAELGRVVSELEQLSRSEGSPQRP